MSVSTPVAAPPTCPHCGTALNTIRVVERYSFVNDRTGTWNPETRAFDLDNPIAEIRSSEDLFAGYETDYDGQYIRCPSCYEDLPGADAGDETATFGADDDDEEE